MKILKVIHGLPPLYSAGSEVYSQSICQELSKSHQVLVFTREENPFQPDFSIREEVVNSNLRLKLINMARAKDGYLHDKVDHAMRTIIGEFEPDVAHIGHLNHLSTGIVEVLKEANIPIVFTLHDFWLMCPRGQFLQRNFGDQKLYELCTGQNDQKCANSCYKMYYGKEGDIDCANTDEASWTNWIGRRMDVTRSICDKVDLFIAPSRHLMNRFIQDFSIPRDKIKYLDYGFPTHYLEPSLNPKPSDVFRFGYIGTHIPSKGVNLLIEAFQKLELPAELYIWGAKDLQSTNALKLMAYGNDKIQFMGGYVNQNLSDEVFSRIDCIVVPSIWTENSPLVIHEAQACHIPVITANTGGMAEYVEHNNNGLLFEHRNSQSLLEQMHWAIENPDEMKCFGSRGYLYSDDGKIPAITDHCRELEEMYNHVSQRKENSFWRLTLDTNPEDCNLSCTMCEEHSEFSSFMQELYEKTGVKRRRMPFSMVERIMESAKKLGVLEIIPSTMGEPLLYKNIEELFSIAKKLELKINLTTNGTFPKKSVEEWAEIIVPLTSDIKISWNGATKETMEGIMKKIDFEKAIDNVRRFIAVRDAHFKSTGYYCRVTFQLTFMKNNMHELPDIIKLAADVGVDRVKGHHLWAHFDEIKELSFKNDSKSITQWNTIVAKALNAQEQYRRPNGERVLLENIEPLETSLNEQVREDLECPFLGKELWISATGKISPCCAPDNLRQQLGDFGNVNEHDLEEVINSEQYMDLCLNYKSHSVCQSCNMRKSISK